MNANLEQLFRIAQKKKRIIMGLMSGTSFDGLDIALCGVEGHGTSTRLELLQFITQAYDPTYKEAIKSIFAKRQVDLQQVTLLHAYTGKLHGELVLRSLQAWGIASSEVDVLASHGQTVFHAPARLHGVPVYGNATLQLGDGDHLAVTTGIVTLSDFRQKHIAAGGEGAPLVGYGDYLLFSDPHKSRILLNIGGIANFTWLPARNLGKQGFSTDVGPGNTLMDQYVQWKFPGLYYDRDASIASQGTPQETLLKALFDHPFFQSDFPKTTGPELFNLAYLKDSLEKTGLSGLSDQDILATLAKFSAEGIIRAIETTLKEAALPEAELFISGGGIHNPLLKAYLENHFNRSIRSTESLGVPPDAKEAMLFALLANECLVGDPSASWNAPGSPAISMGKLSFPY